MARIPKRAGPHPLGAPVAETLVLEPRRDKIEQVVRQRTRSLVVVLDRIEDPFNMAAVLRTCEAFGVQEVHIIEHPEVRFSPNERVTQGCDKWLDLHRWDSFASAQAALAARGFSLWVSSAQPGATSLWAFDFTGKRALVFGNERTGVSKEAVAAADGTFWIPMRGFTRSLNVSAAVAVTLGRAMAARAEQGAEEGALSLEEAETLRAHFHALSVKQRRRIWRPEHVADARHHAREVLASQKEGPGDQLSEREAMALALEAQTAARRQLLRAKSQPKRSRKKE